MPRTFEDIDAELAEQERQRKLLEEIIAGFLSKYPEAEGLSPQIIVFLSRLRTDETGRFIAGEKDALHSISNYINFFKSPEGQKQWAEWTADQEETNRKNEEKLAGVEAWNAVPGNSPREYKPEIGALEKLKIAEPVGYYKSGAVKYAYGNLTPFIPGLPKTEVPDISEFDITSETGRKQLAKAVKEHPELAQAAYGGTKGKQKPWPGMPASTEDLDKAAYEMQKAGVGSDDIRAWMTQIAPQVRTGNIEQEMDTRSPWVKWQQEQAGREQAQRIEQLKEAALQSPDVIDIITRAKKAGIPEETIMGWIPALQMSEVYQESPGWGATRYQIQNQLAQAELTAKFRRQTVLGADYPEEFAAFAKTPGGQPAGWSIGRGVPGATIGFFETWAMNQPALKAKMEAQRASRYAYYPGSTEAYEQATEAGTAFETGPRGEEKPMDFMNWLRANPQFAGEFRRGERSRLGQKAGYAPRTRWI